MIDIGIMVMIVPLLILILGIGGVMLKERCPKCGSKFHCELLGEWDGYTQWKCHRCDMSWFVPYDDQHGK